MEETVFSSLSCPSSLFRLLQRRKCLHVQSPLHSSSVNHIPDMNNNMKLTISTQHKAVRLFLNKRQSQSCNSCSSSSSDWSSLPNELLLYSLSFIDSLFDFLCVRSTCRDWLRHTQYSHDSYPSLLLTFPSSHSSFSSTSAPAMTTLHTAQLPMLDKQRQQWQYRDKDRYSPPPLLVNSVTASSSSSTSSSSSSSAPSSPTPFPSSPSSSSYCSPLLDCCSSSSSSSSHAVHLLPPLDQMDDDEDHNDDACQPALLHSFDDAFHLDKRSTSPSSFSSSSTPRHLPTQTSSSSSWQSDTDLIARFEHLTTRMFPFVSNVSLRERASLYLLPCLLPALSKLSLLHTLSIHSSPRLSQCVVDTLHSLSTLRRLQLDEIHVEMNLVLPMVLCPSLKHVTLSFAASTPSSRAISTNRQQHVDDLLAAFTCNDQLVSLQITGTDEHVPPPLVAVTRRRSPVHAREFAGLVVEDEEDDVSVMVNAGVEAGAAASAALQRDGMVAYPHFTAALQQHAHNLTHLKLASLLFDASSLLPLPSLISLSLSHNGIFNKARFIHHCVRHLAPHLRHLSLEMYDPQLSAADLHQYLFSLPLISFDFHTNTNNWMIANSTTTVVTTPLMTSSSPLDDDSELISSVATGSSSSPSLLSSLSSLSVCVHVNEIDYLHQFKQVQSLRLATTDFGFHQLLFGELPLPKPSLSSSRSSCSNPSSSSSRLTRLLQSLPNLRCLDLDYDDVLLDPSLIAHLHQQLLLRLRQHQQPQAAEPFDLIVHESRGGRLEGLNATAPCVRLFSPLLRLKWLP